MHMEFIPSFWTFLFGQESPALFTKLMGLRRRPRSDKEARLAFTAAMTKFYPSFTVPSTDDTGWSSQDYK